MIFVTVGTHEQPFQRLVDMAERAAARSREEFAGQSGHTTAPLQSLIPWRAFLPFEEMQRLYRSSRITVTHGGTGSVMTALQSGKMPVVVPRYAEFGEHVDDHQVQFVRTLAEKGLIIPVLRGDDLEDAIEEASRSSGPARLESNSIGRILADFVDETEQV